MPGRLVLGTAQLGMAYGINNRSGQPSVAEARAIIAECWTNGILEFDTAQAYGESEKVLGQVLSDLRLQGKVRIISKLDPKLDFNDSPSLREALNASLGRLCAEQLQGLMLHNESALDLWQTGLGATLSRFVGEGKVERLGVSVYSPEKAVQALQTNGVDFLQVPSNLLDRRFEKAGVFKLAAELEKDIYIRSVFLQGLLLMKPGELSPQMAFAAPVIEIVDQIAEAAGLSRIELAMAYVRTKWPDASVVFGAESKAQVTLNAGIFDRRISIDLMRTIENAFASVDERIINPVLWPKV